MSSLAETPSWIRSVTRKAGNKQLRLLILAFCADDPEVIALIDVERVAERIELYLEGLDFPHYFGLKLLISTSVFVLPILSRTFGPVNLEMLERLRTTDRRLGRLAYIGLRFLCLSQIYAETALLEKLGYGAARRSRERGQCSGIT